MTRTPAEIAAGLSKTQRRVFVAQLAYGREGPFRNLVTMPPGTGEWHEGHYFVLTPLGRAVAAHLEEQTR